MKKTFSLPLLASMLALSGLLLIASPAFAQKTQSAKVQEDTNDGANSARMIAEAIGDVQNNSTIVGTGITNSLDTASDSIGDAFKKSAIEAEGKRLQWLMTGMPKFADIIRHLKNNIAGKFATDAQEYNLNLETLQYLQGNKLLTTRPNPYINSTGQSVVRLYQRYVSHFCIPNSYNAPSGCGSLAQDGGYFAPNMIQGIVGERTWTPASMEAALDFVRAYFGIIPQKPNIGELNDSKTYVEQLKNKTRANMRLSVVNALMARRAPFTKGDNTNFVGELFKIYYQAGYISSNHPEAVCRRSRAEGKTAIESTLCQTMNKQYASSKAVSDRVLQYDFYMSPSFLDTIYSHEYPAKGSLERLEVTMQAQRLAQDYQFLRDLQMYTALRAVNISKKFDKDVGNTSAGSR
jgi:hypothetical protein